MPAEQHSKLSWLEAGHSVAQIVQAIAAVVALCVAAWWFWQQRELYPRADVTQSTEVFRLKPGIVAIETQVSFQNSGKQLIELTSANVKLQALSSEPYKIGDIADLQGAEYWGARRPGISNGADEHFAQAELRWPVLKQYNGKIEHRVEPGETDLLVFSFVVPCNPTLGEARVGLQKVRIASDIYKPANPEEKGYAWKARSVADVSKVCGG